MAFVAFLLACMQVLFSPQFLRDYSRLQLLKVHVFDAMIFAAVWVTLFAISFTLIRLLPLSLRVLLLAFAFLLQFSMVWLYFIALVGV